MHILMLRRQPIAAAVRFQRLCMEMADPEVTDRIQAEMHITSGTPRRSTEVLK